MKYEMILVQHAQICLNNRIFKEDCLTLSTVLEWH